MPWATFVVIVLVTLSGCPSKEIAPAPVQSEESSLAAPEVNAEFLQKAFSPGTSLANKPLLADIDGQAGTEALIAIHHGGKDFEVAVVRANRKILAHTPLGGKILAQANITFVGEFRPLDLLSAGQKAYVMPLETLVWQRSVCGFLVFRYRHETLSLIGEFACKCWRKEVGGDGSDPYQYLTPKSQGSEIYLEIQEEEERQRYRWDAEQTAFVPIAKIPGH